MAGAAPYANRFLAACSTYLRRPLPMWFWGGVTLLALFIFFLSPARSAPTSTNPPLMLALGIPVCGCAALLALHAQSVFARPEARLTPGYAAAHAASLGVLILGGVLFATAGLSASAGLPGTGVAAGAVMLTALICWGIHTKSAWFVVAAIALVCSEAYPPTSRLWNGLDVSLVPYRIVVLGAGSALLALWGYCLLDLNEERSGYHVPPVATAFVRASRSERAEQRKLQARQAEAFPPTAWLIDRHGERFLRRSRSLQQLIGHGLAGMPPALRGALFATLLSLACFGVVLFVARYVSGEERIELVAAIWQPILFTCIMPGSMVNQLVLNRRAIMEQELLRPMTREAYIAAFLATAVRDAMVQTAAMVLVTLALVGALMARQWPEHTTLTTVGVYLTLAFSSNLLISACSLFFARWRLGLINMLLGGMAAIPILVLLVVWVTRRETISEAWFLLMAVLLGVLAGVVLYIAKRVWLSAELG